MQKSKAVLAVDFDDVVASFNRAYVAFHNAMYGPPYVTYDQIVTFDMPTVYGVAIEEITRRVRIFCHEHHHTILPCPDAHLGLARLAEQYDLHLVTSRSESLLDITQQWLEASQLSQYFTQKHFTNAFGARFSERKVGKLQVCQEIGAMALIDDAPIHAQGVADGGIIVYMPERPWNTTFSHKNVRRIQSLQEIPLC
jgi:hypothetical protein